jgi:hypothetical protein
LGPKEEAKKIVDSLFDELGTGGHCPKGCPFVDGYDAVDEMETKNWPSWKQVEWQGFYLKHKIRELSIQKFPGKFEPWNHATLYLLKGKYIWDIRFNAINSNEKYSGQIPFLSVENIDRILDESDGLGLLIANSVANYDFDGKFIDFLEKKKLGKTEYDLQREAEGRPPRIRKTAFMINRVYSYFFPDKDIHKGPQDGWVNPKFQEDRRQFDGGSREGKYLLYLDKIPLYYRLDVTNFNEDPDDWEAEFGE